MIPRTHLRRLCRCLLHQASARGLTEGRNASVYAGGEKKQGDDIFVDQNQFQMEPFVRSKKLNFQTGSRRKRRKKGSPTDGFDRKRCRVGVSRRRRLASQRASHKRASSGTLCAFEIPRVVTSASGRAKGQALAFSGPSAATRPRGKRNDDLPMELIRFHRASPSATLARPIGEDKRGLAYL